MIHNYIGNFTKIQLKDFSCMVVTTTPYTHLVKTFWDEKGEEENEKEVIKNYGIITCHSNG